MQQTLTTQTDEGDFAWRVFPRGGGGLHSQGVVVPYRWGSDTSSLFFRLRRPTPCAPIRTSVFLLKGGTLATSSYIRSSWRSNSSQKLGGWGAARNRKRGCDIGLCEVTYRHSWSSNTSFFSSSYCPSRRTEDLRRTATKHTFKVCQCTAG